jgi:hypothetical protein
LDLRIMDRLPFLCNAVVLAVASCISFAGQNATLLRNAAEAIIPLAFGLQAAFLLTPENEPAIELLLSYPTALSRLLWERILSAALLYIGTALAVSMFVLFLTDGMDGVYIILGWLTPAVVLCGLSIFISQITRQGIFGALAVILAWGSSLYGGNAFLKVWPRFWLFHIYLQPENTTQVHYLINRLVIALIGLGLMMLASILLLNEERVLGVK